MTGEECAQGTIGIARTRDGKFVGSGIALGVLDLPFVNADTTTLIIEKRRTQNALFIKVTGADAP